MFLSDTRNVNLTIFTKKLTADTDFETRTLHTRENRTSIIGMVYDKTTENLFWTDTKEQAVMSMHASSNGSSPRDPITVLKLPDKLPRGISLDVCNRRLYWANSNMSHPSIESSNLDGSNATIVVSKNLYEPLGVTVDHWTGKLYWIDDEEGVYYKIERSNLDGSEREILVYGRHQQPYDLAVDRDKIYWTDWTYRAIWSIKKNPHPSELPSVWASFHAFHRDADPKCIIARDNLGPINCAAMRNEQINIVSSLSNFAGQENDNLITSTEEVDAIKESAFKCLNDGVHDSAVDKCNCKPGFDGLYCERSMCHNYCLHGECFITSNGQPRCKCGPSFQGPRCEQNVCLGHCLNDGYCSIKNGEPYCTCKNSRGPRCEQVHDVDEICSIFCLSGLTSLSTIDTSLCSCANETQNLGELSTYADKLWCKTVILGLSTLSGLLFVLVGILSFYVHKFRHQRRIRKHIVVNKASTPLTARPQIAGDQCEIMIENCCNMNICETPCFEPKLRNTDSRIRKKDEKNSLLDNMEGNSC
ncbi:protein cueball isoform X2 [Venturia canescens]|nr:protein cueball isoform X2 [Venturia canescens]